MNRVNVMAYCIRPAMAAIIAVALAFTFTACSSDDGKDDGDGEQWCAITEMGQTHCIKIGNDPTYEWTKEECNGFVEAGAAELVSNTDVCED